MSEKTKDENSGTEMDGDPMKGVKEIKGADAPMEPEVKIDIEKHKDAEDPDSSKNKNGASAPPVDSAAPAQPVAAAVQPAVQSVKPSHGTRNCLLIALLLLCFVCLSCCVGTYFMRDRLLGIITNSAARQDTTLKTVTPQQIQSSNVDLETLIQQKKANAQVSSDGTYTMTFTEAELLSALFNSTEGNANLDPSSVGLKFEPGVAKIQIDVGKIIASNQSTIQNNPQLQNLPIDLSLLSGVLITADLKTNADGTKLIIENLSTGNAFLDSLIPQGSLNDLENQFDLSHISNSEGETDLNIQKIEFLTGEMRLTIQE